MFGSGRLSRVLGLDSVASRYDFRWRDFGGITGATKMPIKPYLEGGGFTPNELAAMSQALEETTDILGARGDKVNVEP
jgi:hypothetical protein